MNRKVYFVLGCILIGLAILYYSLFEAGIFDVRDIEIRGNGEIESVENVVDSYLNGGFGRESNIFLIRLNDLEQKLLGEFPQLKFVKAERSSLHSLLLTVSEKEPRGIYCLSECYFFDSDGVIYDEAPQTKGFLILTVRDERNVSVETGSRILNSDFLESIYETEKLFNELIGIDVRQFIITHDSFDEFWAETEEGWLAYMRIELPERQLNDLKIFLNNQFSGDKRKNLIYADLRLEGRVYYKTK